MTALRDEIWRLWNEGYRHEVIAGRVGCSYRTVHTYLSEKRREEGIPPAATGFALPRKVKKKLIPYAGATQDTFVHVSVPANAVIKRLADGRRGK